MCEECGADEARFVESNFQETRLLCTTCVMRSIDNLVKEKNAKIQVLDKPAREMAPASG